MNPEDAPLPLVACALLWIGLALGMYLPAFWLNVAMTCLAAVTVPVFVVWKLRQWKAVHDARTHAG